MLRKSMLTALGNAVPTHLLDRELFDFKAIGAGVGNLADELDSALGVHDDTHTRALEPQLVALTL